MKGIRRRIVREKVVQALYAHEITDDPLEHVIECIFKGLVKNREAFEFSKLLVYETVKHEAEIDTIISGKVANWDFSRIAMLDRLILRMAICELLYFKEIPPKVSMDEAIELAKLFSTEKSGQFVNGVLDAVFESLKQTGHLTKAGRGLWGGKEERTGRPAGPS
ncbi:MAG: transcription antitermination factor NusB [Ignavibacteria bacterium]|nr:transcription antitermination factor NusB [Ignavibacteria bacterium]